MCSCTCILFTVWWDCPAFFPAQALRYIIVLSEHKDIIGIVYCRRTAACARKCRGAAEPSAIWRREPGPGARCSHHPSSSHCSGCQFWCKLPQVGLTQRPGASDCAQLQRPRAVLPQLPRPAGHCREGVDLFCLAHNVVPSLIMLPTCSQTKDIYGVQQHTMQFPRCHSIC